MEEVSQPQSILPRLWRRCRDGLAAVADLAVQDEIKREASNGNKAQGWMSDAA